MNIDSLLRTYYPQDVPPPTIEVFDDGNVYEVFSHIVKLLYGHIDIEIGVLQALHYCFYEILDNVLVHSEKKCGTAIQSYDAERGLIKILVADDGIGIAGSLRQNEKYKGITELQAVEQCVKDTVTDGKGMGFGLYSTACLVKYAGVLLEIRSGKARLRFDGGKTISDENGYWKGTLVYIELDARREINPNNVVDNRTDCESQFNETFSNEDFENLW